MPARRTARSRAVAIVCAEAAARIASASARSASGASRRGGGAESEASEAPSREVASPRPFFVGKYEVTQAQCARVMGVNPSKYRAGRFPGFSSRHPVERVSWDDCQRFARRLGARLPSEAEWEYAARAGTRTPWWSGAEPSSLLGAANVTDRRFAAATGGAARFEAWDDGYPAHAPVGAFQANGFGLHDVHGNIAEWCQDDYQDGYQGAPGGGGPRRIDGAAERAVRGGSWVWPASKNRSAARQGSVPGTRHNGTGLRLARSLPR